MISIGGVWKKKRLIGYVKEGNTGNDEEIVEQGIIQRYKKGAK